MRLVLFAVLALFSLQGIPQEKNAISIENPWSRATTPGAKLGAGYMVVRNNAARADRLVGASSPLAGKVETHVTIKDGEILRMREVKGYDVPAKGSFELKPGGAHLMFVELKKPLKEGDKVPVTLRFEKAGEVKVELDVRARTAGGHMMKH